MQPSAQQRLRETFQFEAADLAANRSGRLSERQEARLRAASSGARLALALFAAFTLGSAAWAGWPAPGAGPESLGIALLAGASVLAAGTLASRGSLGALRGRTLSVAEGSAEPAGPDRLRVGGATLRLASPEQCDAFDATVAYRVFYLAGPRALVLSAEALGADAPDAEAPAAPLAADPVLRTARRARWVLLALGALALQMPLAAAAAGALAPGARALAVVALFAEGVAFATFAVWWLGRR